MAVKMKKPDYWPALEEGERLAGIQRERDARRRSIINKEDCIRIRGANEHNLKNLTLEIPRNELVVLTGLSGSGKSSLAFDTIYAEGQRRYMESLSSYARQFLGQMEKPDVEKIEGLSPAISIDQKSTNRNPRSTVGTVTEIYDYFRLLYARIGIPHCPNCGREIARQTVDQMVDRIMELPERTRIQILAPVVRGRKGEHQKVIDRARKAGYVRLRIDGNLYDVSEDIKLEKNIKHNIEVIVDRLVVKEGIERRLTDSVENALQLADGLLQVDVVDGEMMQFSQSFACPDCGISVQEIEPRSFSFNNPFGACPVCAGLGYRMEFAPELIIPDETRSINEGAIAVLGWQSCMNKGSFANAILVALSEKFGFSLDTPYKDLKPEVKKMLMYGTDQSVDVYYEGQRGKGVYPVTFDGLIRNTEQRYRETGSDTMKAEYESFMRITPCGTCGGKRLRKESLAVTVGGIDIYDLTCMSIRTLQDFLNNLELTSTQQKIGHQVLKEIKSRVGFLIDVGLDYLTLARATATLSGGEAQRIRLATQIGSGLVGVCYILDEPSIGLHQRDNDKLLRTLKNLRDLWNTVIVVEHDEDTMLAADYIVDIGPGAGSHGGKVVAQGTAEEIMAVPESITGQYLSGKKAIPVPEDRREPTGWIKVRGARVNNLKDIDVEIPLGIMTVVTGVSGSGKSSLVNEILYKHLAKSLNRARTIAGDHDGIDGLENLDKVIAIDQSPIGRTPRSNPATYTGVFDMIRARRRRHYQDRDALPAGCLRALRGLPWQALQPRDARSALQRQEYLRCFGHDRRGGRHFLRECALHKAQDPDALRRGTRLREAGTAIHRIVGRRGAEDQTRDRIVEKEHRKDDLYFGRADDGTSFRGRRQTQCDPPSAGGGRQHGGRHRAQPGCDQDSGLHNRYGTRRRRRRRHGGREGNSGGSGGGALLLHGILCEQDAGER